MALNKEKVQSIDFSCTLALWLSGIQLQELSYILKLVVRFSQKGQ